jgi:hypothetical protein
MIHSIPTQIPQIQVYIKLNIKIMCGVVEMNKEAEWAKTAPYCEFHRPILTAIGILF